MKVAEDREWELTHEGTDELRSLIGHDAWSEVCRLVCTMKGRGDRVLIFPSFSAVIGVCFSEPVRWADKCHFGIDILTTVREICISKGLKYSHWHVVAGR